MTQESRVRFRDYTAMWIPIPDGPSVRKLTIFLKTKCGGHMVMHLRSLSRKIS